ncbi:MAG: FAD-binding protein [Luteitalea sp.]|nr:FAD-binding protein [Luteitalea sp.]
MPIRLLEPPDAETAAAMLAQSATDGLSLVPRGCGTKLSWGGDLPRVDAFLSTRLLSSPIDHFAGDLVATVPAGATLAEVNAVLAHERQWLPIDPAGAAQATIGGIVATNDSGPRRQKHGATRDLIIGIEIALADGRRARAGGRVVKNVAGYDLARLMCGSFGTLAVILSATFKLAPLAPASRTVIADVHDAAGASDLALQINAAPLSPSAIELQAPRHRLLIRFETTEAAAIRQSQAALAIVEAAHGTGTVVEDEGERDAWRRHEALVWAPGGLVLKVSVLPTEVAGVLTELERLAAGTGFAYAVVGRAALGVLAVRVDAPDDISVMAVEALRRVAARRGGAAIVIRAPAGVMARVDPWGDVGAASAMMQAVKSRFDPLNTLSPGRGPAGL